MSICIIQLPSDFDERYKKYRTELGDKNTRRSLAITAEIQERAVRDLAMVNEQLQNFAKQISASSALFDHINKQQAALKHFQDITDDQNKMIAAWASSMSPILKIVRETQERIDQLGVIPKLNDLRGPIVQLATSAIEAQRAVESFRVADTIKVTESVKLEIMPSVGEVVLPSPKQQKTTPTPPTTTSTPKDELIELTRELVFTVRKIEAKMTKTTAARRSVYTNKEDSLLTRELQVEVEIGKLAAYSDGSVHYGDEIIDMRNQLKDLCRLFMRRPNRLVTIDDIRDTVIAADKREVTPFATISKYVSELHQNLKSHFGKAVIFNQKEEGWFFRP